MRALVLFERLRLCDLPPVESDTAALAGACCSGTGVNCGVFALRRWRGAAGAAIAPRRFCGAFIEGLLGMACIVVRRLTPSSSGRAACLASAGLGASHISHLCAVPCDKQHCRTVNMRITIRNSTPNDVAHGRHDS